MLYFDYTATTPIDEEVLNSYIRIQKNFFANTTSLHKLGQISNYMFEQTSQTILDVLNIKDFNLVYTSNATEANNLGIFGIVEKYQYGKIITTKIEHPSVFEVFKYLEKKGYEVVYLDVDNQGLIDLKQLEASIDKMTILVSIMWVNNIVGVIEPIDQIIKIMKKYPKAHLHVDAVQGLCKIIPNFDFSDIDLFTFSAHKMYGPKGIGALAYKKSIILEKRLYGSNSQYGVKPGTLDLALVVAICKTIKMFYLQTQKHLEYVTKINQYLRGRLRDLRYLVVNSGLNASPYIVNISIPNVNGETIVRFLEAEEIYVSTGSACSSKLKKPEKTILFMTKSIELATSSIRISLSHLTTYQEIDKLIEALEKNKYV